MADEDQQVAPGEAFDPEAQREPAPAVEHGVPVSYSRGQKVLHPGRADYLRVAKALHDDGFLMCIDVTGVDYLTHGGRRDLPTEVAAERFEVVVELLSHSSRSRVRLRVQVPADDATLPSLWQLYPSAEAAERETYDMYGVSFEGHPDLTRILMPEDWIGHPLRKDYNSGRIPVQFKSPASSPVDSPGGAVR